MGFTATAKSDFKPAPDGSHPATCVQLIDLGHQVIEWQGHEKQAHKIIIGWELDSEERRDDGSPFIVFGRYTLSLSPKSKLRPILESWRGKAFTEDELEAFDISKLLSATCLVNVVHNKKDGATYANVASVAPLPKKMGMNKHQTPIVRFDLEQPDMTAFEKFSEKLRATIKESQEWRAKHGAPAQDDEPEARIDDSSVPF